MISIQETKKEIIEKTACQALWWDPTVSWEVLPAINSAGGILCMWSDKNFKLESKICGNGFIRMTGQWIKEAAQGHIVAVYSPCDIQNKRILWNAIKQMKENEAQESVKTMRN